MKYLQIDEKASKIYPYTISDSWGGKAYLTEDGLKELFEEIKKVLDKQEEMWYNKYSKGNQIIERGI